MHTKIAERRHHVAKEHILSFKAQVLNILAEIQDLVLTLKKIDLDDSLETIERLVTKNQMIVCQVDACDFDRNIHDLQRVYFEIYQIGQLLAPYQEHIERALRDVNSMSDAKLIELSEHFKLINNKTC